MELKLKGFPFPNFSARSKSKRQHCFTSSLWSIYVIYVRIKMAGKRHANHLPHFSATGLADQIWENLLTFMLQSRDPNQEE